MGAQVKVRISEEYSIEQIKGYFDKALGGFESKVMEFEEKFGGDMETLYGYDGITSRRVHIHSPFTGLVDYNTKQWVITTPDYNGGRELMLKFIGEFGGLYQDYDTEEGEDGFWKKYEKISE